jgi:hypothetical protein
MDSGYGKLVADMIGGIILAAFIAGGILMAVVGVAGYYFAKWMGWL